MCFMVKLNLGAADQQIEGYTPIEIKNGQPAYPLTDYADNSVDEIRASHVLEHFSYRQVPQVVSDWHRVLKPGGRLRIAVPDFDYIVAQNKIGKNDEPLMSYLLGMQLEEHDFHKSVFTKHSLGNVLKAAGFSDIESWESEFNDCAKLPVSLNLSGIKIKNGNQSKKMQISAVQSMPRLGFTSNFKCAAAIFPGLNIQLFIGEGVFWDQVLTRMLEERVAAGDEFIITVDYDTIFDARHVQRICQLLISNPKADAVCPLQIKREKPHPMLQIDDGKGGMLKTVPLETFDKELVQIATGHFGLTVFRASAFKDLKKPWFVGKPDKDGGWNEGRQDPDTFFWVNWHESGKRLYLASNVGVGHTQNIITWPGTAEDNWALEHQYRSDFDKTGPPAHITEGLKKEPKTGEKNES